MAGRIYSKRTMAFTLGVLLLREPRQQPSGEVCFEAVEVGAQDFPLGGIVDELTVFLRADEAGQLQLFHVVRERGGRDVKTFPHI